MSHLADLAEPLCKNENDIFVEEHQDLTIKEIAASTLAFSPSCGPLMLIDKIITSGVKNDATGNLVQNLINRVHRQTISIAPSADDNPETFVSQIVETAEQTATHRVEHVRPLYHSAKLLLNSLKLYKRNKLNLKKLEHHWKDFAAILFNERLKAMTRGPKASS